MGGNDVYGTVGGSSAVAAVAAVVDGAAFPIGTRFTHKITSIVNTALMHQRVYTARSVHTTSTITLLIYCVCTLRVMQLEEELSILRDRSRALLEEAEIKVERLQATARQHAKAVSSSGGGGGGLDIASGFSGSSGVGRIQSGTDRIQSGSTGPLPPASGPGGMYTPSQVLELQRTAVQYRLAYEDSERTHQLRDQTESALKEEVAKQQVGGWHRIEGRVSCVV